MSAAGAGHLLDSTILIAHLRGDERATALLLRRETYASVVSRSEVEGGTRSAERSAVARLFDALTLLPVTDEVARTAGRMIRSHRRSHAGIDLGDYLIAATADVAGLPLITLNVKHFPMFAGLQPPFPG
ncbi:MAG TPA: type II toxin-antitoxin system VapC family toxin [Actinomycetota bacterium]|nr:type II toxin-antitoxin system VapC family toxin [Actinomycetota bacterium]